MSSRQRQSESAKWQFSGREDFQHTPVQLASVYPAAAMQNRPRICASPCGSFRRADLHLRQWSRTMSVPTADVEKPPSAKPPFVRDAPDTFNFLRHVMRAIWSLRPKCSHRCVSLKETPLKLVCKSSSTQLLLSRANRYENEMV